MPGVDDHGAAAANDAQIADERMCFAHERERNLRGNPALEAEKHLRGILDIGAEVGISGRSGNGSHLVAGEPAQAVNQVNA